MAGKKNPLDKAEVTTAADLDKQRTRRRKNRQDVPGRTKAAAEARRGKRKPVPVPKNKSSQEIRDMDPDDPAFKHPDGRKRKYNYDTVDTTELPWREVIRVEKQKSSNKIRAKARKNEAVVEAVAREELDNSTRQPPGRASDGAAMYAEDVLISDGKLSLDDWDEEELIRGFRRQRNGRFGDPPKFIPREVQQEAFRRLVRIGERKMRQAYLGIIDQLIALAMDPDISDKVRLDAIKEIQNRVVGKTPDIVVTTEAPWQDMLVDSLIPLDEANALEVHGTIKPLPPGGGEGTSSSAAATSPAKGKPSSPPDGGDQESGDYLPLEATWEGEDEE